MGPRGGGPPRRVRHARRGGGTMVEMGVVRAPRRGEQWPRWPIWATRDQKWWMSARRVKARRGAIRERVRRYSCLIRSRVAHTHAGCVATAACAQDTRVRVRMRRDIAQGHGIRNPRAAPSPLRASPVSRLPLHARSHRRAKRIPHRRGWRRPALGRRGAARPISGLSRAPHLGPPARAAAPTHSRGPWPVRSSQVSRSPARLRLRVRVRRISAVKRRA